MITILTKAQITHLKLLQDSKYRKEFAIYIAEGEKTIAEFIKKENCIDTIYSTKPIVVPHILISEMQMQKISALQNSSSMLAVIKNEDVNFKIKKNTFYIILDGIQDPGNLGTIIRIADWYGITDVICSNDCADAFASKVVQASMGSIARIKVHKTNLLEFLNQHKNVPTYAAMLQGTALNKLKNVQAGFIIIGAEGKGVSKEILATCKNYVTIPGFGNCESLNAAVACGIICSHLIL